jgi:hypothetical protein
MTAYNYYRLVSYDALERRNSAWRQWVAALRG